MQKEENAWSLSEKELYDKLVSSKSGLNDSEVIRRLKSYGLNDISESKGRHGIKIFFSQFKNSLVLLLIAAAIISYFLEGKIDTIVILSIVIINSFLGFFQEYKAEKALLELQKYISTKSKLIRDGKVIEVDSREIVTGDIVYLNAGDIVPADIRLIESSGISANESSLTGESLPVMKNTKLLKGNLLPQRLENMVFMGTSIVSGNGIGIVIATGKNTFFGKSASYIKLEPEGDFQKNIKDFSNFLLKITLGITIFVFIINAFFGRGIFSSFLFALALAIGITPEALPMIITLALSRGAAKMAKQKVIVKKLDSIEDIGNIDILCCDKTGTLTEGVVSLVDYHNLDNKKDEKIVLYGMLCNSAREEMSNDPIDNGILKSSESKVLGIKLKNFQVLETNEFDFVRRRMGVLVKEKNNRFLIVKGAPESVLKVCKYATINNRKIILTNKVVKIIENKITGYEENGYRVIAVSEKSIAKNNISVNDEKELNFLGFLLLLDPPKKDTKEALELFEKLGINLKIISGDSPLVTKKICDEIGLDIVEDRIITGDDLGKLSEKELEDYVKKYNIFARITPDQKYIIVSTLSSQGNVVGFLGDGINDAPALKIADVGISVEGAAGIAKDSADIVILKKNLRIIADGIMEGRKTFGNTIKYILNTMSANYGNMATVAASSLFLNFIPLLPSQILLTNLATDVPCLSISTDNVDQEQLKKPRHWNLNFIHKFMIYFGLLSTIFDLILIVSLMLFFKAKPELFRTAWFVESVLSEIIIVFAIRTRGSFIKSRPSELLLISSVLVGIFAIIITYTSLGASFFEFVKMPFTILIFIFIITLVYFISVEFFKRYFFKKYDID